MKSRYLRADNSKNVSDITHGMLVLPPPRAGVGVQAPLHRSSLGLGQGGEQHDVLVVGGTVPKEVRQTGILEPLGFSFSF